MAKKKATNGVTPAIISYITIIGWLLAYFVFPSNPKTDLELYHMRQSLGLHLSMFILFMIFEVFPFLGGLSWILQALYLVAIVLGVFTAKAGESK